ncbi:MAG: hypothetical protein ACI8X5_002251 [Planctomycetota bacterium]|jgi:hypothetical protein
MIMKNWLFNLLIAGLFAALLGSNLQAESATSVTPQKRGDSSQTKERSGQQRSKTQSPKGQRSKTKVGQRSKAKGGKGTDKKDSGGARRAQAGAKKATADRASNARTKVSQSETDRATNARIKSAEKDAKGATYDQRVRAAGAEQETDEAAAQAKRVAAARADGDAHAQRVEKARTQDSAKGTRVENARVKMSEEERAQRVANARRDLAGLDDAQARSAKRFLVEQDKHTQRLAKIDRVGDLLRAKGDAAGGKRVEILRAKELASFKEFQATMRKSLSGKQADAIQSAGEAGTVKRARLQGSSGSATRAKKSTNAQERKK